MSAAKHTPWPWTQGHTRNGKECVWLDGKTEPPEGQGLGPDSTWIDCGTEGNARLIAATEDLMAVATLAASDPCITDDECGHCLPCMARAAIAKITTPTP